MKTATFSFAQFRKYPTLVTLLSTKKDGGMNIRYELERDEERLHNRNKFFSLHNISNEPVVAQLVHGNTIAVVAQQDAGAYIPKTDGLLTNQKGVFLSITVADCLPIYLYDPEKEVIGILHAGWKGLDKNIISSAVAELKKTFDVKAETLLVGIGPGIDACHFAVQKDLIDTFSSYSHVLEKRDNEYFLNLKQIAKQQLLKTGVMEKNIEINLLCTDCERDTYFSYRRDKSNPLQAMVASIGLV